MAQVRITRIGTEYFREYAIEPGDQLIVICLWFGHSDWQAVYNHPANAAFKTRFPDPDQIDFVNPVNLFVPLAGASTSGKSRKGKPVADYIVARIRWPSGSPVAEEKFQLLGPGQPTAGKTVTTSVDGELIISNADPGDWKLASATYALVTPGPAAPAIPPRAVTPGPAAAVLVDPVSLPRNAITDFVARPIYVLHCPMCWTRFAVVAQPAGTVYACPDDGFDLTSIVVDIDTHEATFLAAPIPRQDPTATPTGLHCRGVEPTPLTSAYGPAKVYWDESRFAAPDAGDYTLRGTDVAGVVHTAVVVGRHTWGALAPHVGPTTEYKFHLTLAGASAVYTFAVPSNENRPLTDVMHWMTIHHSTDAPLNSFQTPRSIQQKHFVKIGAGGPGADVGYHFIIDGDGTIYEGRPLGIKGSHVPLFNGGNIGIVLMGDFERGSMMGGSDPTAVQLASMNALVDTLSARFGVKSAWWHMQRTLQAKSGEVTECPGARLITLLPPLRTKYPGPPP